MMQAGWSGQDKTLGKIHYHLHDKTTVSLEYRHLPIFPPEFITIHAHIIEEFL